MFYLRKIEKSTKRQSNRCLGQNYSIVHAAVSPNDFKGSLELMDWMTDSAKEKCYAVISDGHGALIPLMESDDNYIMTESGKTFAKV